jgi:HlyD family secretion protein
MSLEKSHLDALKIDRSAAPRGRSRASLILGILFAVLVIAALVWWFTRSRPTEVRTVLVQEPVSGGGNATLLNAAGYVTARREATVSSKVTGKVMEVLIEEGMKVEAGQILAKIDSSNVEKSLALAEAQAVSARKALDETRANLEQAQRELRRAEQLASSKIASQSELDRAQADVQSLQARLGRQQADIEVAEREVASWKQQLEDTIIRAPFSGIVTSKNAQPGEMISPISAGGGFTRTGICTIVDMSSLEIEVDVSESYINRVKSGQSVQATLDAYPEWRIPAKVIAIIPTADRQKATVKVRVGFEKMDPRILPEMSVKVAFQNAESSGATERIITLPKTAVKNRDGRDVVWLVREGRVERRAVTVGVVRGDEVTIAAGVGAGDRVIVPAPENLADGASVKEAKR